jgi:hypothetical protein
VANLFGVRTKSVQNRFKAQIPKSEYALLCHTVDKKQDFKNCINIYCIRKSVPNIHILLTKTKFSKKRKLFLNLKILEGRFQKSSRAKKCPRAVGWPPLV